jgi:hypothetical protein
MNIDQLFVEFKANPTPENGWKLNQAMVAYSESHEGTKKTTKDTERLPMVNPHLKTRKGGDWDLYLSQFIDICNAFDWEIIPFKSNKYLESWKVTEKNLNQAVLYLGVDGFSMGSSKKDKPLTGAFEGYEDKDRFTEFLYMNGIEIE